MIMKKIQQRKSSIRDRQSDRSMRMRSRSGPGGNSSGGGGRSSVANSNNMTNNRRRTTTSSSPSPSAYDDDDDEHDDHDDEEEMLLREAREWHEQDEMSIGTGGEEGLEAMTRALTNHPVAWWEMRKQWQKRRGGVVE